MPFQITPKDDGYDPVAVSDMIKREGDRKKRLLGLVRKYRRADSSYSAVRVFKQIKELIATL